MTMTKDLSELRQIAEAANHTSPWLLIGDEYIEPIGLLVAPDDGGVSPENAEHIEAFDPLTMLALLTRLENAEAELAEYKAASERVRAALVEVQGRGEKIRARGNNGSIYQQERAARGEGYLEATRLAFLALDGESHG